MVSAIKPKIHSLEESQNDKLTIIPQSSAVNVLGIAGSMRKGSYSTQILKMVLEQAKKYGSKSRVLELRETKLPIYDPGVSSDKNGDRDNVLYSIAADIKWAEAFILASPDYHGSMSGAIKNFLDYFWEEFAGKTFGYIVASHEKGLTVADQMRTSVRQCYGWSMPYNISIDGRKDFDSSGNLINSAVANRIKMLGRDLVVYGTLIRGQFLQDVANQEVVDTFASHYREYYN